MICAAYPVPNLRQHLRETRQKCVIDAAGKGSKTDPVQKCSARRDLMPHWHIRCVFWCRKEVNLLKRKPTIASTELIAKLQGGYYVATGIWPLLSMRTFEAITGPKVDKWLVKTVGVLVSVIGATLWVGGTRRQVAPELKLLAMGSAAGLTAIEIVYVARRRISPIYLLDAALEAVIVACWIAANGRRKSA
jgi:hypothetical protein